jgi:hypothetical protein
MGRVGIGRVGVGIPMLLGVTRNGADNEEGTGADLCMRASNRFTSLMGF